MESIWLDHALSSNNKDNNLTEWLTIVVYIHSFNDSFCWKSHFLQISLLFYIIILNLTLSFEEQKQKKKNREIGPYFRQYSYSFCQQEFHQSIDVTTSLHKGHQFKPWGCLATSRKTISSMVLRKKHSLNITIRLTLLIGQIKWTTYTVSHVAYRALEIKIQLRVATFIHSIFFAAYTSVHGALSFKSVLCLLSCVHFTLGKDGFRAAGYVPCQMARIPLDYIPRKSFLSKVQKWGHQSLKEIGYSKQDGSLVARRNRSFWYV